MKLFFRVLLLATALFAPLTTVRAQTETVRGSVIGPDNKPLANQEVVLHRVTGPSGLTVATSLSAADGSFALDVKDVSADPDAVYFLAARYNGELYLGDAFKAPFDTTARHVVQVGVAATSARNLLAGTADPTASAPATPPPPDPTRWLIYILPALALLALAAITLGRRTRIPARRKLLLEIARLDEAQATGPAANYREQRDRLVDRIAQSTV